MSGINLGSDCFHNYWHISMQGTTQFGTLTIIHTFALNEAMHLVDSSWRSITLDTQTWDRPRVEDISSSDEESDMRTCWKGQSLIHFQTSKHTGLQISVCYQIGLETIPLWNLGTVKVLLWCWVLLVGVEGTHFTRINDFIENVATDKSFTNELIIQLRNHSTKTV